MFMDIIREILIGKITNSFWGWTMFSKRIPDFDMVSDKDDNDRIRISYKNVDIIGIDPPRHWNYRDSSYYEGWILHRWVHNSIYNAAKIDFEIIPRGEGVKIVGVDEI